MGRKNEHNKYSKESKLDAIRLVIEQGCTQLANYFP